MGDDNAVRSLLRGVAILLLLLLGPSGAQIRLLHGTVARLSLVEGKIPDKCDALVIAF